MAYVYERPPRMNVTDSLGDAFRRSKFLLFERGTFPTWLRFGVIGFLSSLGSGGGNGGGNYGSGSNGSSRQGPSIDEMVREANGWVIENFVVVAVIAIILIVFVLGLSLLLAWLKSRGQAMMIHAVSTGDPTISTAWSYTSAVGNSAFFFRAILWFAGTLLMFGALGFAAVIVVGLAQQEQSDIWPYLVALVPVILVIVPLSIAFWIIELLFSTFVVPLMYRFDAGVSEGWRHLRDISGANWGPMLLLFIIRFAYSIAFTFIALFVGCLTCCVGFLPVIHHTLFAPFYVFDRAYSLYALQYLGPDYAFIYEPISDPDYDAPPPLPPAA